MPNEQDYTLIDTPQALDQFYEESKDISWMCFDTEFVGEKRYQTLLCLIQVATPDGNYIIDPLALPDIDPFLDMVTDPELCKITHAGENDYRLLYNSYGILPRNIFDTQVAAGFVGYKYPISFNKLVASELDMHLKKAYAVADWTERPFRQKSLGYALNDVLPLYDLYDSLSAKLDQLGRRDWADNEFARLEQEDAYLKKPHTEALNTNLIRSLKMRDQVFLIRLYEWRRSRAEEKNYSKEMILPSRMIGHIVKSVRAGMDGLRQNRRLQPKFVGRYGEALVSMYNDPVTAEEKKILDEIPTETQETPREEILTEQLFLLMKYRCLEENIAPSLLISRNQIRQMRTDSKLRDDLIGDGWRRTFLGEEFMYWLENINKLRLDIDGGTIKIRAEE